MGCYPVWLSGIGFPHPPLRGPPSPKGRLTDTEAVSSSILNFQFSIFNAPKAHRALFPLPFSLFPLIFSPFPQGKADGYRYLTVGLTRFCFY